MFGCFSGFGFCLDLLHFVSLLTSYAVAYFIHTFMGNRPKVGRLVQISLYYTRSGFMQFPNHPNWEVNADLSLNRFLIISQIVQLFVISSYIEGIETNLRIEKTYLACIHMIFEQIVGKKLIRCFIYVFVSICSQFVSLFAIYAGWTERCGLLSRMHLSVRNQSWQTGPNESALHFKVVF